MFRTLNLLGTLRRRKRRRVGAPSHTCVFLPQDQVEAADGGGPGAAGRSWELLGPAEDVSITLFLPPEPAGQHGQHHGGRSSRGHVQQHVPDSTRAPSPASAAPGTPSAHPRLGSRGTAGLESLVQPYPWHPAPSVKKTSHLESPFPRSPALVGTAAPLSPQRALGEQQPPEAEKC